MRLISPTRQFEETGVWLSWHGLRPVRDRPHRVFVWAHHMFTSGISVDAQAFFAFATLVVAVLTG
jgi:hypothetical protein